MAILNQITRASGNKTRPATAVIIASPGDTVQISIEGQLYTATVKGNLFNDLSEMFDGHNRAHVSEQKGPEYPHPGPQVCVISVEGLGDGESTLTNLIVTPQAQE
jgi:hypothetical protein